MAIGAILNRVGAYGAGGTSALFAAGTLIPVAQLGCRALNWANNKACEKATFVATAEKAIADKTPAAMSDGLNHVKRAVAPHSASNSDLAKTAAVSFFISVATGYVAKQLGRTPFPHMGQVNWYQLANQARRSIGV